MNNKDIFISYSQYMEDIVLAALLQGSKDGFYVDVGANDEEYHSVTKHFYEMGWRGINIEPIPHLFKQFGKKRKRDINLNVAISENEGELNFREYPDHNGLSTLSQESQIENSKLNLPYKDYKVPVRSLKSIFGEYDVKTIDFLKIDVEGYEYEVLKSNDWDKYRPRVICIEANHRSNDWSKFLKNKMYARIINDGLNEYYVSNEEVSLFDNFAEKAAINSHNAIRSHHAQLWTSEVDHLKSLIAARDKEINTLQTDLHAYRRLSLHSKGYLGRLKVVTKGLTTDYIKHKLRR